MTTPRYKLHLEADGLHRVLAFFDGKAEALTEAHHVLNAFRASSAVDGWVGVDDQENPEAALFSWDTGEPDQLVVDGQCLDLQTL